MAAGTYIVGRAEAGRTVTDWLRARLGLATTDVHRLLRGRCVTVGGAPCSDPSHRLRAGQRLVVRPPSAARKGKPARNKIAVQNQGEPAGSSRRDKPGGSPGPQPVVVFADPHVVVVDKPPGLTTMRHADEAAEFGHRRTASCRRPWPTCCPACWRRANTGRRAASAPSTGSTATPAASSSSRTPPRPSASLAGSSGALHGSALSRLGARPGEGRPHRVGAGARPRRRPARQRE